MPINDLAAFTLFKAAEDGNPDARAALTSVGSAMYAGMEQNKDEMQGPPIEGQALSSVTPEQAQNIGINPASAQPPANNFSPTMEEGGQAGNPGALAPGGEPKQGLLGKIGSGILEGIKIQSPMYVADLRAKQQERQQREHDIWAEQWKKAQEIPPEVLNDPKFSDLAKAYQGMQADIQKGDVSNMKNANAFMSAMAYFKNDIDQINQTRVLENQKTQLLGEMMNKSQANMAMAQQMKDILDDPTPAITPEQQGKRLMAQNFLATLKQQHDVPDPNDPTKTISMMLTDEEYLQAKEKVADVANRLNQTKLEQEKLAASKQQHSAELGMRGRELEETRKWRETQYGERQRGQASRVAAQTINQAVNDAAADLARTDPDFATMPAGAQRATAQQKVFQDPQMQQQLARGVGAVLQKDNRTGKTGYVVDGKFYTIDGPDMMRTMQLFHQMLAGGQGEGF